jgi:hypothetical protein
MKRQRSGMVMNVGTANTHSCRLRSRASDPSGCTRHIRTYRSILAALDSSPCGVNMYTHENTEQACSTRSMPSSIPGLSTAALRDYPHESSQARLRQLRSQSPRPTDFPARHHFSKMPTTPFAQSLTETRHCTIRPPKYEPYARCACGGEVMVVCNTGVQRHLVFKQVLANNQNPAG